MPDFELNSLILTTDSLNPITDRLNEADHNGRMNLLYSLSRKALGRLYALAASAPPLTLEFFVGDRGPLEPVAHHGWNSIPVPTPWRKFQKVMCRPNDDSHRLLGYNEYRSKSWLGPGYFDLMPTANSDYFEERGAYVVDYFRVPDGDVPPGWPKIKPNTSGLSRFVYGETRDYLRGVSQHVSVGRPYRGNTPDEEIDFSFVLCRD
jgi:hypothetical protein